MVGDSTELLANILNSSKEHQDYHNKKNEFYAACWDSPAHGRVTTVAGLPKGARINATINTYSDLDSFLLLELGLSSNRR
jgi:hypothetical protein